MSQPTGLGTLLRNLTARLDGDLQAIYDEQDLPFRPRFYPVFQHLEAVGTASIGALSSAVGVTQPAMSQTIAEMRRLGLVMSVASEDPRQRLVRLTADGEALALRLRPIWAASAQAAIELEEELSASLSKVLGQAIAALERDPFRQRVHRRLAYA